MNSSIVKGSFVVVSDFHGYSWPLDKVAEHYLNEYETIYILGDSIDRGKNGNGSGSIGVLLDIKLLADKYPNRIVYVPGNHDCFLYEYAAYNDRDAYNGLNRNGGAGTISDYIKLLQSSNYREEVENMIEWLGNLPIQRKHEFNGKKYVLAHAMFNQQLFDRNPNFSLNNLYTEKHRNRQLYDHLLDIIWFRKENKLYTPNDLPKDDSIMIIGHTPLLYREGMNLDLKNSNGDIVKVHCVDGGVAYDGRMLKFDGGQKPISTEMLRHKDTSPKSENESPINDDLDWDSILEKEKILREIVIETTKSSSNLENAYLYLQRFYLTGETKYVPVEKDLKKKAENLSYKDMNTIIKIYAYIRDASTNIKPNDDLYLYIDYIDEKLFNYIISCTEERFGSMEDAIDQIDTLFEFKDYTFITESIGNARTIAMKLGIDNMKKVITKNHHNKLSDYVYDKFEIDNPIKSPK